jgi:acyl-CoA thioesterase-1
LAVCAACSRGGTKDPPRKPVEAPAAALTNAVLDTPATDPPGLQLPDEPPPRPYRIVLHTGDSTVGGGHGLARALKKRFEAEGSRYVSDTVNAASLLSAEFVGHIGASVDRHRPDLVLVNLGTNEVFVPAPKSLVSRIRAIVHRIGRRDCIWIGPPTWKGDKGLVDVLRDNAAPCRFFDSSNLGLERLKDGIHPTDKGGEQWAEQFWAFFRPT